VRWRLALVVLAAVAGAAITVVLVSRGGSEGKAQPTPRLSIQGPQVRIGDLVYNITAIRILQLNKPGDAPYLTNYPPPPKGNQYLGIFMKVYNLNPDKDLPSAPGYLLESVNNPGVVTGLQSSESPYAYVPGAMVPAGSELPIPGTAAAGGPTEGALMLIRIKGSMTQVQPWQLTINQAPQIVTIRLPRVPKFAGGGH
jgi:hypothetical protein